MRGILRLDWERMNAVLSIQMLGPLAFRRGEVTLELPASRKVRAVFAFLALSPRAVGRSQLCDLVWDVPNDPRGELRWCLSKLRRVLDDPGRKRIETAADTVALHLDDCFVDTAAVEAAVKDGLDTLSLERLVSLSRLFSGEFLDGLEVDRSPQLNTWLVGQRRRYRSLHIDIVQSLVRRLPAHSDELSEHLETWLRLAPYDVRPHIALLTTLAERGEVGAGEEHVATAAKLFQSEELDFAPVRAAWKALREQRPAAAPISRPSTAVPLLDQTALTVDTAQAASRRASLVVMPFEETPGPAGVRGGVADGLTHDIITRLAKLRNLFIIARGSAFALAEHHLSPEEAGRRLNVDFVACGSVRVQSSRITINVEVIDVRTANILWAEVYDRKPDDTFSVLDEIGNSIVASISSEIEMVERNRAVLKAPSSLNAWEAYHRGLWHMYRFTRTENELARHFFESAIKLDPTFARAYAGLSFTHWQNAFQRWGDRDSEIDQAYDSAGQSLFVDEHNPAAHWAMGRALWLRGRDSESLDELTRAVDLSPNFALGHYALSFVHSQSGDANLAIGAADHSRHLSPFDPLLFGMLGTRAMAHVRLGQFEEAAEWALKAAARPNAHVGIMAIAAHCLALAERPEEGAAFASIIRRAQPGYGVENFLATFRFTPETEAMFRTGAQRIGMA